MTDGALVCVVDDDVDLGNALARLLGRLGYAARAFADPAVLLADWPAADAVCVVTDIMMGDIDGFTFAERLRGIDPAAALVFMTAWPTTAAAVDAIRRFGGIDYLDKPIDEGRLERAVAEGIAWSAEKRRAVERTRLFSPREREVFALIVRGKSTKAVAAELGLSPKTVEVHRAAIMAKARATCLADLITLDR